MIKESIEKEKLECIGDGCDYYTFDDRELTRHQHQCEKCHGFLKKKIIQWAKKDLEGTGIHMNWKKAQLYIAIYERHISDKIALTIAALIFLIRVYGGFVFEGYSYSGFLGKPGIPYNWLPDFLHVTGTYNYDGNFDGFILLVVAFFIMLNKVTLLDKFEVLVKEEFFELLKG